MIKILFIIVVLHIYLFSLARSPMRQAYSNITRQAQPSKQQQHRRQHERKLSPRPGKKAAAAAAEEKRKSADVTEIVYK
jgi:hypothetical protein